MKKLSYLITHGDRTEGFNPTHTLKGVQQIQSISIPNGIRKVVVGAGTRFREIFNLIKDNPQIAGTTPLHSPFCGGYDGLRVATEGKMVTMTDGDVPVDIYLGLIGTPGFDPWAFINGLGERTLICGGGELLIALGYEGNPPKGALFALDVEARSITLLQQG